jgi:hypothetical protein
MRIVMTDILPMRRLCAAALVLATPSIAFAQGTTADQIRRAVDMYNNFNIEGARPILQQIISPSYLQRVEPEERVTAYKYLGASFAVLDKADSAAIFFTAALDFDPFTDLDPREFSAAELNAFNTAKQRLFKVALRPITPRIIDSTYAFRLISTHRSSISVDLIDQRDTLRKEVLYQGENDGPRELRWNGLLRGGQRADSAIYELRVVGRSLLASMAGSTTTDRQLFRIEHVYEPLEDTLPEIPPSELLQQEHRQAAPWFDLMKGAAVGVAAVALPLAALDKDVRYQAHAATAGAVGLGSAVIALLYRRANRTIPANVRENTRRQTERANFNAGVRRRNLDRLNATTLLICPPTGCPR